MTTKALIDTGSPRCVFPRGVGDLVGVGFPKFPSQAATVIHLMGRPWPAVTATVELQLEPFDPWEAVADFVVEEGLAFALLGYEGFLNRFAVSFNGALGYLVVEPADDFDNRQPAEIATELRQRWPNLFR